jgi:hypothetical protein
MLAEVELQAQFGEGHISIVTTSSVPPSCYMQSNMALL